MNRDQADEKLLLDECPPTSARPRKASSPLEYMEFSRSIRSGRSVPRTTNSFQFPSIANRSPLPSDERVNSASDKGGNVSGIEVPLDEVEDAIEMYVTVRKTNFICAAALLFCVSSLKTQIALSSTRGKPGPPQPVLIMPAGAKSSRISPPRSLRPHPVAIPISPNAASLAKSADKGTISHEHYPTR